MFFVLHKNKIISYLVAASIVSVLFIGSLFITPNTEIEVVPVSSNQINKIFNNAAESYINTNMMNE